MSDTNLEQLLASKEVVVVCGPGGVGKTTVAASAALLTAQRVGGRVLVLTVDPARRLATALGLEELGNTEVQVDPAVLAEGGMEPRGELWAAQLDTKKSWDDLVRRHAPDEATREAILDNSLYENVTGKFVQSHDYIAMERLHEIHASGQYDLIVVDTPPSRNAIDFLEAPERMADFFSSRLLRWLTVPYRSRLFTAASKPFYNVADRVLGQEFLRDIADFFLLFQTMYEGFVHRAEEVQRTLRSKRTTFWVVSTLEPGSINECAYFVDALDERELNLGAVVLNRVLPSYLGNRRAGTSARTLGRDHQAIAERLVNEAGAVADVADPALVGRVLGELSESFLDYGLVAARQQELRADLSVRPPLVAAVPYLTEDVVDVAGLASVARALGR